VKSIGITGGIALSLLACIPVSAVPPDLWLKRTSPISNRLNAVTYAGGSYVAAGDSGTILVSSNASDWTPNTSGTSATFYCTAQRYVPSYILGGELDAQISFSYDGLVWTNVVRTTGPERIYGIAYFNGYTAVASGAAGGTNYLLNSPNGVAWTTRPLPTTNALFAISSVTFSAVGFAGQLVAVGDHGTILTSSNGMEWVIRDSGTAVPLRAAVFHHGRMIVGGDSGIVLSSADGISWSLAAPTSFNIRGLASSGNAIVAVGNYSASGRLHVSADGLSWPGTAKEFPNVLNAVAYCSNSFVAVGDGGLILQSEYAPPCDVNAWTKPTSGYWEEMFWSCGHLPAPDQPTIAFTNAGWKALAIGPNATANVPDSLTVGALVVEAPSASSNLLLLNYAGTNVPLKLAWLVLGTNASLVSHYSAVSGNLLLSSAASFDQGSVLNADYISLRSVLSLSDSYATGRAFRVMPNGRVSQSGGATEFESIFMLGTSDFAVITGILKAKTIYLQADVPMTGLATFVQMSGDVEFGAAFFGHGGFNYSERGRGEYLLSGGSFSSSSLTFLNGAFTQTGGASAVEQMELPSKWGSLSDYLLSAGSLVSSNVTVGNTPPYPYYDYPYAVGKFTQAGGVHSNSSLRLVGYWYAGPSPGSPFHLVSSRYVLTGGIFASDSVRFAGGTFIQTGGSNYIQDLSADWAGGSFTLSGGELVMPVYTNTTPFTNDGGIHRIQDLLELRNTYALRSGILKARKIHLAESSQLNCRDGVITNEGMFMVQDSVFDGSVFSAGSRNHELGQLQVQIGTTNWYYGLGTNPCSFDVTGPVGTLLRFRDSHDIAWSGRGVRILAWQPWSGTNGSHHIFIGTNEHGLSSNQLSRVIFVNPPGWPPGNIPALLLSTGELVPAVPPSVSVARHSNSFVLSWPDDYDLFTATNVSGPYSKIAGATSPFTNSPSLPQQYFRLALPP
jgi:hypothetical protein